MIISNIGKSSCNHITLVMSQRLRAPLEGNSHNVCSMCGRRAVNDDYK